MGTHPIFESDFDCLTDQNSAQNKKMKAKGDLREFLITGRKLPSDSQPNPPISSSTFCTRHDRSQITILVFCIILQKGQQNRWRNYFSEKDFGEVANSG